MRLEKSSISLKPTPNSNSPSNRLPQEGSADQIHPKRYRARQALGKRSSSIGVMVQNVYTAKIYDAVALGKPFYERVITVSGRGVARRAVPLRIFPTLWPIWGARRRIWPKSSSAAR